MIIHLTNPHEMKEKPNYYGILPANVRYDKALKPMSKVLYSEITALSNKLGYCTASNQYFAELYEVSPLTISRWFSQLRRKKYVRIVIERSRGNARKIYPNDQNVAKSIDEKVNTPIDQKINTYIPKDQYPIYQKINTPIDKKIKYNNTSNNSTSNNTKSNIKADKSAPAKKSELIIKKIELTKREISEHMKIVLKRLPEANIQAEFYHRCREEKINCILEYKVGNCKFDAVVYDDKRNALLIIEFKSYKTNKAPKTNTKQIEKYKKHGLSIMMVTRFDDVEWAISYIKDNFAKKENQPNLYYLLWEIWAGRHEQLHEETPGKDAKYFRALKSLADKFKKRIEQNGDKPTQELILENFGIFLDMLAHKGDQWYLDNFTPDIFNSKFQNIVNLLKRKNNAKNKRADKYTEIIEELTSEAA